MAVSTKRKLLISHTGGYAPRYNLRKSITTGTSVEEDTGTTTTSGNIPKQRTKDQDDYGKRRRSIVRRKKRTMRKSKKRSIDIRKSLMALKNLNTVKGNIQKGSRGSRGSRGLKDLKGKNLIKITTRRGILSRSRYARGSR